MSILMNLEKTIFKYIKDKIHLGSITPDQLRGHISVQIETLSNFEKGLSGFDKAQMVMLHNKYREAKHPVSSKNDISKLVLSIPVKLTGAAQSTERQMPFSSIVATSKVLIKILSEISKNVDDIIGKDNITMLNCRLSSVMVLGILREADIFSQVAFILWKNFTDVCFNSNTELLGYQAQYVQENFDKYIDIVNDVLSRSHNYDFLKDIADLQKKNTDLVLYANDQSFLHFLNPNNIHKEAMQHLKYGLLGFGLFTWMVQHYDDWKHERYLKNKDFKSWLEARSALLRLELNKTDPNSQEYQKLLQIIQAYDAKIVSYDRKIAEYERG